jgi:uncharacterized caspase-like protein
MMETAGTKLSTFILHWPWLATKLKTLAEQMEDGDVLVFFYSGHGRRVKGKSYI